jgi:hypothetical protein
MMRKFSLLITSSLLLTILLAACTLPGAEATPDLVATWVAGTLTAIEPSVSFPTLTPRPATIVTNTLPPAATETPLPSSTPQNPLVLETILCWKGPGAQFEVVSALKKDERVELIGQGSIAGWWIVDNPIYHDPCWAQAAHLQIEPGYNTSLLPIYTPPPTPTSTPTNTRTPTITPTTTTVP